MEGDETNLKPKKDNFLVEVVVEGGRGGEG